MLGKPVAPLQVSAVRLQDDPGDATAAAAGSQLCSALRSAAGRTLKGATSACMSGYSAFLRLGLGKS